MKLVIGICDDCEEQIEIIENQLMEFRDEFKIEVLRSTDPLEFFSELEENRPDLVFLDIDMDKLDGIKLGERIKEKYRDTIIIYITGYEKYALDAFRVRAFHYLIKPVTIEKFSQVFKEATSLLKDDKNDKKNYIVKKKGEYIYLNYDDIYYFEKKRHLVKICTVNGDISFYETFKNLLHEIDMNYFIRCHQGYIVNISKVRAYRDQKLILDENLEEIPVSRSHIKEVKEMVENRLLF